MFSFLLSVFGVFIFINLTKIGQGFYADRYKSLLAVLTIFSVFYLLDFYIKKKEALYFLRALILFIVSFIFLKTPAENYTYCNQSPSWKIESKKFKLGEEAEIHPCGWKIKISD